MECIRSIKRAPLKRLVLPVPQQRRASVIAACSQQIQKGHTLSCMQGFACGGMQGVVARKCSGIQARLDFVILVWNKTCTHRATSIMIARSMGHGPCTMDHGPWTMDLIIQRQWTMGQWRRHIHCFLGRCSLLWTRSMIINEKHDHYCKGCALPPTVPLKENLQRAGLPL